jgi:hypothetical protein
MAAWPPILDRVERIAAAALENVRVEQRLAVAGKDQAIDDHAGALDLVGVEQSQGRWLNPGQVSVMPCATPPTRAGGLLSKAAIAERQIVVPSI